MIYLTAYYLEFQRKIIQYSVFYLLVKYSALFSVDY